MATDIDAYEDLVWKNARIVAKNLHKVRVGDRTEESVTAEMAAAGMLPEEIADLIDLALNLPDYDADIIGVVDYAADTFGFDDGPGLGKDALLDEGVYELVKEAFYRIHKGKF